MVEERPIDDDLESFAAALKGLTPKSSEIDRHRVMRELATAGNASDVLSMRRKLRFWKLATGISTVASIALVVLLLTEHAIDRSVDLGVANQSKGNRAESVENSPSVLRGIDLKSTDVENDRDFNVSYIDIRNRALVDGVDKLPLSAGTSKQSRTSMDNDPWPLELPNGRFGG